MTKRIHVIVIGTFTLSCTVLDSVSNFVTSSFPSEAIMINYVLQHKLYYSIIPVALNSRELMKISMSKCSILFEHSELVINLHVVFRIYVTQQLLHKSR